MVLNVNKNSIGNSLAGLINYTIKGKAVFSDQLLNSIIEFCPKKYEHSHSFLLENCLMGLV